MISLLERRVCDISYRLKLGHLSSCLSAVGILDQIYTQKRPRDIVVLSAGHAGLALYVALEKHEGKDAEALYRKHGTHPNRDLGDGIHVSAGSLGCGITIALGLAMADRSRDVYCLVSDGECWEGAAMESLALKAKHNVANLKVWVNHNGYTCIEKVNPMWCLQAVRALDPAACVVDTSRIYTDFPFLRGVEGHYYNLKDADCAWLNRDLAYGFDGVDRDGRVWYGRGLQVCWGPSPATGQS